MNLWKIFNRTALGAGLFAVALNSTAQLQVLDKIVAVVDDDVVLKSEVDLRMATISAQIQQSGTQAPPADILRQQIIERLISERLQLTMGQRAGVRISDAELNQAIERIAAGNGMSLEQYAQEVHAQGGTLSSLREQVRNEMIIMRVQQGQVMRRIHVSEQELDNFLNSEEGRFLSSPDVNIGHILLPVGSGAQQQDADQVLEKISTLREQAQSGTDFRQLAIANSADQTALQGGDLGWRKLAQLPGVFIEAVEQLQPGEVSAPVRSDAGYHLIKLYERRGGGEQMIEQHFARHILMSPNEIRDQGTTVEQLTALRERIANGEDFAALAKEFSEDPGSALKGGELGWSVPGMFVPEFEQTMSNIPLNDVSQPFQSQFGWHILQVTERRHQDFSEDILRNRAQNVLRQRKFEEELQVWLQEIRDEAFVEVKQSSAS